MFLKILAHPVLTQLNFYMPMIVDLSHPLIMLTGENGSGKSTLLHSMKVAFDDEQVPDYLYRLEKNGVSYSGCFLFDAEQHNPRMQMDYFADQPDMQEFLRTASHGQIMLSLFRETFPKMPEGSVLLLDEPEMALSASNQARILKMLLELVDKKRFRIVCATHSAVLLGAKDTYVINLDDHKNKTVLQEDHVPEGLSTIH